MIERRVTMRDLRALGYCARGCRDFFRHRGWNWPAFLREGLPVETFEATGDAMAISAAARVREQVES